MPEIPEHLLKRSAERRKQLAGDDADAPDAEAPAEAASAGEGDAAVTAPAAAAADSGDVITEDKGGIPAHLLERSRKRKAALAGDGGEEAAAGGAVATATKAKAPAAPAPGGTGPGGHTQRLLTVVKSGSIQQAKAEAQDKVHTWPHLLAVELAATLGLLALITVFSALVKAPLLGLADLNQTPNPSKAPWYFLGLQEMVSYSAFWGGVGIPTIFVLLLLLLPYLDRSPKGVGVWFSRHRLLATTTFTALLLVNLVLVVVGTFFRGPNWAFVVPWEQPAASEKAPPPPAAPAPAPSTAPAGS